jgi:hypothetical protein
VFQDHHPAGPGLGCHSAWMTRSSTRRTAAKPLGRQPFFRRCYRTERIPSDARAANVAKGGPNGPDVIFFLRHRTQEVAGPSPAAPVNGIGIAGVAPEATLVALKACTTEGFCFGDSVAAALRYTGNSGSMS